MAKYIVYNDSPTVEECLLSIHQRNRDQTKFEWFITSFEFAQSSSPGRDDDATHFSNEVQNTSGFEGKGSATRARLLQDCSCVEPRSEGSPNKRRKVDHHDVVTTTRGGPAGADESGCHSFCMFPPPSQPRQTVAQSCSTDIAEVPYRSLEGSNQFPEVRPSAHAQEQEGGNDTTFARHYNLDSLMFDTTHHASLKSPSSSSIAADPLENGHRDDSDSSLEISIGPPPCLPWAIHDLTKLDLLRKRFSTTSTHEVTSGGPLISILAVVSSLNLKQVGHGLDGVNSVNSSTSICEIVLEDETGGIAKLVAWGQQGQELDQALRIGDVVFFGKVRLSQSRYNPSSLELRLIENVSKVGISYRTRVYDRDVDELYRFDLEGWSKELEQVREVLEIVTWWEQYRT